ncbi:hypothetical protein Tco_1070616 [Tanacetum coccineum]|uniref:Uncharacterized protein n=1 Tax=Tanacetum coccineum TaxID=301880 RepID=A0ABQ5HM78_9ASTR
MADTGPSNILARRVTDDLIDFSGETSLPKYMMFFFLQQIVETRCFIIIMREDDIWDENTKLIGLNDVIAQAEDKIATKEGHVKIMHADNDCSLTETASINNDSRVDVSSLGGLGTQCRHQSKKLTTFPEETSSLSSSPSLSPCSPSCPPSIIDGWVFDIPCKLNALPTLDPSSSINKTKVQNTLDGVSFEIDSISELHHIWSSFGATTCKVKYISGSLFSLEFQNNEEGCNFTRVDYKKGVEQGVEFKTGSNHVGDGFDSSRDNDGSVDAGEASWFPAHSHEKDNSNFKLGYGSDSYVEKKGHLTDNGSSYGKGDGDLSQSEVGDVDLSPSCGGEKVGLITPSPSTNVKERCISYCHGLDHVEISNGLNFGNYAIPNQRVNTSYIISQNGKLRRNEKATHLKKRKMKTMNLFKIIQIKQCDKLMNDMKKGTPRLRSSKALKLFLPSIGGKRSGKSSRLPILCVCAFTHDKDVFPRCLNHIMSEIDEHKWALFYRIPKKSLDKGLKLLHTDNDVHSFFDDVVKNGSIHLYVAHKKQNLGKYYYKNMEWEKDDVGLRCSSSTPFDTRFKRKISKRKKTGVIHDGGADKKRKKTLVNEGSKGKEMVFEDECAVKMEQVESLNDGFVCLSTSILCSSTKAFGNIYLSKEQN